MFKILSELKDMFLILLKRERAIMMEVLTKDNWNCYAFERKRGDNKYFSFLTFDTQPSTILSSLYLHLEMRNTSFHPKGE